MEVIERDPHGTEAMLKWLDHCFQLGAVEGAEDLALAATELVMRWDLDAFEKLIGILMRVFGRKQVQRKAPRIFRETLWQTNDQALQKIMEVMHHA